MRSGRDDAVAVGDASEARDGAGADPVEEAAAGWVARLASPDATEADRAAFETWRAADPAHAEAYADLSELWHRLGQVRIPAGAAGRRRGWRASAPPSSWVPRWPSSLG